MRSFGASAEAGEKERAVSSRKMVDVRGKNIRCLSVHEQGATSSLADRSLFLNSYLAGSTQGTIGMSGAGLASGPTSNTAMAPRSAPVSECVTSG